MTEVMERRISREVVGVRILRREDSIAVRIAVSTPAGACQCRGRES